MTTFLDNYWRHVDTSGECWLWTGRAHRDGYGWFWTGLVSVLTHRLGLELATAEAIPAGMQVLHSCDVTACVNPAHLRIGTHAENMRDVALRGRQPGRQKTHCVHGHPFDEANTYWRPCGSRDCRACIRQRVAAYNLRRAA